METFLVVDDNPNVCRFLKDFLQKEGFDVFVATNVEEAIPIADKEKLDLVITDLKMPGKSGLDLVTYCKKIRPRMPVIMISAYGNIEAAVTAMKKGAYDFITKPVNEDELLIVIKKALSESSKNEELVDDYFASAEDFTPEFIGSTPAVHEILDTIRKIGPTDSTVLITGETGVGKELVARAIHMSSRRKGKPFVKVNCAAIPETLIESELFGYEKGAFTGAVINKPGRFEIAGMGTLFLDEIGEIPPHLQVKLLTVLQDKSFERVGGVKTIKVDMRIIAATNRDLKEAVESGQFRSDLFYRLNVVPIHIPPLRERRDDLASHVEYFLGRFAAKHGKGDMELSREIMPAMISYSWPGNIRELENIMERMVLMSEGGEIGYEHLPPEIKGSEPLPESHTLKGTVDSIYRSTEKQLIEDALEKTDQNRTKAAKLLGISRRTLQNKIKEYDL
ncbi:sigma-54-dependent Fis family transcriptional regulator [bacterium]|nr:MAG: sigma-54-dependent Fis family transcriptional regulator [bacterium]